MRYIGNYTAKMSQKPTQQTYFIFTAFLLSTLFVVASITCGLVWETNDDAAIAFLLSRADSNYSPFQWRALSVIIHFFNMLFPVVDWWSVCTVFAIWVGAFSSLYVILKRFPIWHSALFSVAFFVLLWFVAVHRLNFTRTAVVVAMGGVLLIADSVFDTEPKRFNWLGYTFGCLLLLYGASIRATSALIALGFLAIIGFVRLLSDHFSFKLQWFKTHLHQILALCAVAILFFAAKFIDENTLASEYRAFLDYNSIRSAIQDYGSTYPSFSEAASEYEAIGINENALGLLFGWFTEDTEVFSQETLLEITKLGTSGNISIKSVLSEILAKGKLVSFIAFLIVLLLCFFKRRNWLRNATVLFFSGLVALYLIFQGRFPIRVYMSILWSAVLSCVFLSSIDAKTDNPEGNATNKQLFKITPVTKKNCVVFLLMIGYLCVIGMGIWRIRNLYAGDHSTIQKEHTRILRTRNREILDTIDQNTDKIYIFDLIAEPAGTFEAFSFWEHRPADFCNNRFLLGGWDGRHPYKISLFDKYDITNPTRALFERTDVYSTYSARLLTHLRHYYDPKMTVSATDVIYDTPIVQYTAFIPDETILQSTQAVVIVDELYCSDDGLWRISASVNPDEEEHAFYVNITIDGERYTYRLAYESGEIFGALYGIDSDSDISMSDICVFERMEDNTYIKYDVFWK